MVPPVDSDIADSILRLLEGWELGNKGLYRKYWPYMKILKIQKIQNFILIPGVQKTDFPDFSRFFTKKIRKSENRNFSGNRNLGGLVIANETTWESST